MGARSEEDCMTTFQKCLWGMLVVMCCQCGGGSAPLTTAGSASATCDGTTACVDDTLIADEALLADIDADGYTADVDCDDEDAAIHPDAVDYTNDEIDQNCSGADQKVVSSIELRDTDADGSVDSTVTKTFNPDGQIASQLTESSVGTSNRYTYTYDEADRLIEKAYDNNNDGTPNTMTFYEYDAAGNSISEEQDYTNDGIVDWYYHTDYNADNRPIRYEQGTAAGASYVTEATYAGEWVIEVFTDYTNPATNDFRYTYAYDANGNMVQLRAYKVVPGGEVLQGYSKQKYDENYHTIEIDEFSSGGSHRIRYFEVDADGAVTVSSEDSDANGTIDFIGYYTKEDLGDGLTKYLYSADHGNDGSINSIEWNVLTPQVWNVENGNDNNNDGVFENRSIVVYDAFGSFIEKRGFTGGSLTPDYIYTAEYTYSE